MTAEGGSLLSFAHRFERPPVLYISVVKPGLYGDFDVRRILLSGAFGGRAARILSARSFRTGVKYESQPHRVFFFSRTSNASNSQKCASRSSNQDSQDSQRVSEKKQGPINWSAEFTERIVNDARSQSGKVII